MKSLRKSSSGCSCKGRRRKSRTKSAAWNWAKAFSNVLAGQAHDLQRDLGPRDRDRLDQYFTSVRDLERRMTMSREWERKPKPVVTVPVPLDPTSPREYMDKVRLM